MTSTLQSAPQATAGRLPSGPRSILMPLLLVFATALVVGLVHHFCSGQAKTTLIYDSRQYLWTTGQIVLLVRSLIEGHLDLSLVTNRQFVDCVIADGPVFPLFNALIFSAI